MQACNNECPCWQRTQAKIKTEPSVSSLSTISYDESARIIEKLRKEQFGLRKLRINFVIIAEITCHWTAKQILELLRGSIRVFYYDLRYSTVPEAHQCMRHLLDASHELQQQIAVPVQPTLLFGIHQRVYRLGRFAHAQRRQLHLRQGAQFILTADRRLHSRGTRVAVYCNCASALRLLIPGETIRLGGSDDHDAPACAEPPVKLSIHSIVRESIVCIVLNAGNIRSGDAVHMPIRTYDDELTPEERSDIQLACAYQVHSIVVSSPPVAGDYAASLRKHISTECHGSVSATGMAILVRCSRLYDPRRAEFVVNTYDGLIYTMSHQCCPRPTGTVGEPIVATNTELEWMRAMFDQQKYLYVVAPLDEAGAKQASVYGLPNIAKRHSECLHYYTDGFFLKCRLQQTGNAHYTSQFRQLLGQQRSVELAMDMGGILRRQLVDRTRSGRWLLARNTALAAFAMQAQAICVRTRTGRTVRQLVEFRPPCPVWAIVEDRRVGAALMLHKGVRKVPWDGGEALRYTGEGEDWRREQATAHLWALFSAVQRRQLLNTDRVIIVCKSAPSVAYCDTFHTCTVLQFVDDYEAKYRQSEKAH